MKETTVLSLSYGQIVVKFVDKLYGLVLVFFEIYQFVEFWDIIVRPIDLQNDQNSVRVGIVRDFGIIILVYMCLRLRPSVNLRYVYRVLQIYDLLKIIYGFGFGLRQNLDFRDIKRVPVFVSFIEEQYAIVWYLDYMDRRIWRYIVVKQCFIRLLEEQKQAIIQQVVTRGLDFNVHLKSSGVEWLGDISKYWEVIKVSCVGRVYNGSMSSRLDLSLWESGSVLWLSSSKVNDYFVETPFELISAKVFKGSSLRMVLAGFVIVGLVGQGRTCGMSAFLRIESIINQNFVAIIPNKALNGCFFHLYLVAVYKFIRELARGGNQEVLNCEIVSVIRLVLPPLEEQEEIGRYIDDQTAELQGTQARITRQIDFIREYRTCLVADVVIGKLDVRGVDLSDDDYDEDIADVEIEDVELDEMIDEVVEEEEMVAG